jgi:ankyrin repeat protein
MQAGFFDTPLQVGCYFGFQELTSLLLDEGADSNLRGGELGSPLHAAATSGGKAITEMLLRRGGDISLRDADGDSILLSAASGGSIKAVRLLLDRGDEIFKRTTGSALFERRLYRHREILQVFLDRGVDINCGDVNNTTALHAAAANGETDCVSFLLRKGADPNVCDETDGDVLRAALSIDNCRESVICCLLANGARVSDGGDSEVGEMMPIAICAANCKNHDLVNFLLDAGTDPNRPRRIIQLCCITLQVLGMKRCCYLF